jgi:glycosyltransferase involved in cell wall biosynthesis
MESASRAVLEGSDAIVVLGEAMRGRVVESGAAAERVSVIPNWSDGESVVPVPHAGNPLRSEYSGYSAKFVVMYSGNMGRMHDFETLLEAARLLRSRSDIRFVFQGDGAKRAEVERAARELPNVVLMPYRARSELAHSLSAADAHLISLSPGATGLVEPSKLYGIMAVGRPAIFVGSINAEVARILLWERCGLVVPGGSGAGLAASIERLAQRPDECGELGARARAAFEARYTRRAATAAFAELLRWLAPAGNPVQRPVAAQSKGA